MEVSSMENMKFINLKTEVSGGLKVSTVLTSGLNGLYYETAVFSDCTGYECLYMRRTTSQWYAVQTHENVVAGLEDGSIILDTPEFDPYDYMDEYWYEYLLWRKVC
jgi:hypothetical protein